MAALSASAPLDNPKALRTFAKKVGDCKASGVGLMLGGAGAWPAQPSYGARLTTFAALRDDVGSEGSQR